METVLKVVDNTSTFAFWQISWRSKQGQAASWSFWLNLIQLLSLHLLLLIFSESRNQAIENSFLQTWIVAFWYPIMASKERHTPQLPAELLEWIANLLGPNDILSFRLACRTFVDVSFDRFTDCYMQEICCFFPDRARVQRLANIISQPHLADRIRTIYLTLDAFEYKDEEITFVAPVHDRGETLPEYKKAYQRQELEYHCAQRSSLDLLSQSFERLNPMRCRLHLDLAYRSSFGDHVEWALISQRVLAAIEKAMYPIYDLFILSARDRDRDSAFQSGIVRPLRSLQHGFYCTAIHSTLLDDLIPETSLGSTFEQALVKMRRVVAEAPGSESLDIIYWDWPRLPPISFSNDVISATSSVRLKRLTLIHAVLLTFENLFQLLRRCAETLEIITFSQIEVFSANGREWKDLFETLSGLPKLEHLLVQGLWWKRDDQQQPLLIVGKARLPVLRCQEAGNASIKVALTEILQKGYAVRNGSEQINLW